ncbi:SMP-30/gluconolactonase/LRE family protein [Acinetobacter sp. YH12145]|uniref:SMP-30/gluconolactonase/LRE family protein n=1 Tax=Acinetobacter sp. YH12145 TaxID=2601129 RepID=UPI0015D3DF75|nr:SMP-30/gluconolactonase/LRE family protein [Acinetobacter sp. YH12145]
MKLEVFAENLDFPEGPIALNDGSAIVVELKSQSLKRLYPNGHFEIIAQVQGAPNGAALGPDGIIYVANNGGISWKESDGLIAPGPQPEDFIGGRIQTIHPNGEVKNLYTHYADGPILAPNDIVMDGQGGFYFTDHGQRREHDMDLGSLSYGRLDGSLVKRLVSPLFTPNGVGISPDGKRVYVSETITGRVWWWEIQAAGELNLSGHGANLLVGLGDFTFFDSLAVDAEGNVSVATMPKGGITTISPQGEVIDFVEVPLKDPTVTNICFGGENMQTAFITASGTGRLYKAQWPRRGLKLHYADEL